MVEGIGTFFIIIGLGFDVLACIGLIRLPDVYNRLQANAKCATFGTCCILFGAFIIKGFTGAGVKALLCIIFLLLTAPVAAHALSHAAYKSGVKLWVNSVCDKYKEDKNAVS